MCRLLSRLAEMQSDRPASQMSSERPAFSRLGVPTLSAKQALAAISEHFAGMLPPEDDAKQTMCDQPAA